MRCRVTIALEQTLGDHVGPRRPIIPLTPGSIERLEPVAAALHEASAKQERDAWQGTSQEAQEEALLCVPACDHPDGFHWPSCLPREFTD